MTKDQFIAIHVATGTPPPIRMLDGRMGLCCHFTDTEILVDAYCGNTCETVRVPFDKVVDAGCDVLLEIKGD